jgi:hypothetical protein
MPIAKCALLALAICAQSDRNAFNATSEGIIKPPSWAFSNPLLHPSAIDVHIVTNDELNAVCRFENGLGGGCSFPVERGVCQVYINGGYQRNGVRFKAVLRHEKAHCYGWSKDHKMERGM